MKIDTYGAWLYDVQYPTHKISTHDEDHSTLNCCILLLCYQLNTVVVARAAWRDVWKLTSKAAEA